MKLTAKIRTKYLNEILSGEKPAEFRQIESMILIDEHGNNHEFKVTDIGICCPLSIDHLKKKYPDIPWNRNLTTLRIHLGDKIN